ncbi:uncharacterized protein B0H64DRAFT_125245 [Chaetomium fimeti]|uniref:Plasma membrane proteolipid 3 n=1 Tax=Chaetomium fimeti TaxID=1854472 RepID=A0AAE0LTS4_9PEZI|nr:hypothetical protein B0H64DRAFT_125245 [Chaetomium fimeti]
MDGAKGVVITLFSILFPPIGVAMLAGCGADLLINIILTVWLFWLPGVLHAFYLLIVYYDRREKYKVGGPPLKRAPFIFSDKVQSGGATGSRWKY